MISNNFLKRTTSMLLMAIAILFGYNPQASAQNASNNYLNFDNYESIGIPANNSGLSNYYQYTEDEQNNIAYLTMSVYGATHAKQNANNNWITPSNGNSLTRSWSASLPFLGGSTYFTGGQSVYGTVEYEDTWGGIGRDYYTATVQFCVNNINEVKLLGKNENRASWLFFDVDPYSSLQVYQYNNNSFSGNGTSVGTVSTGTSGGDVNLSVGGLDETKYYRVVITAKLSYLYEIAFSKVLDKNETALGSYLDITKYKTIDAAGWNKSLVDNLYKFTEYPESDCAWLTLPVYGAFVGARYAPNSSTVGSGQPQKWIECDLGNNNTYYGTTWSSPTNNSPTYTNPFMGGNSYFTSATARVLGANNTNNKKISFYVTNTTAVKVLGILASGSSSNAPALKVYECTKSANGMLTASTTPVKTSTSSITNTWQTFTLTCEGLDATTIYKVECNIYRQYFYEIGFKTSATVKADEDELDFWQAPGYGHALTFNVKAKYISNNKNVTFSSDNDAFTITPQLITAAEAKAGKEVTISFKPTAIGNLTVATDPAVDHGIIDGVKDGEYTGTIDIKYNNKTYHQIQVTGKTYHYPVKVTDAKISTIYYRYPLVVPYDYTENSNDINTVEFVSSLDASNNTVDMKEAYPIIPKEFGVIVWTNRPNPGYKFPIFNEYKEEITIDDRNYLQGTFEPGGITPAQALQAANASADALILTLGRRAGSTDQYGFYKFTGSKLSQYKVYLVYEDASSSNDVNFFSIGGNGGEYTAIQEAETVREQMEDGAWYTLQGVRLSEKPTQRGLYLHNGKKIMVK